MHVQMQTIQYNLCCMLRAVSGSPSSNAASPVRPFQDEPDFMQLQVETVSFPCVSACRTDKGKGPAALRRWRLERHMSHYQRIPAQCSALLGKYTERLQVRDAHAGRQCWLTA